LRKYKKELSCVGECYRRQGLSISGINFVVVRLRKNTIRQTRHRKREKNKESGRKEREENEARASTYNGSSFRDISAAVFPLGSAIS